MNEGDWGKLLGPIGGAAVGGGVYAAFLWDRLSFIPGTVAIAQFVVTAGIVAGFLGDHLVRRFFRAQARQLSVAIASLFLSALVFVLHNAYVVWATKAGYVEGFARDFQYFPLFVTALLWGLPWTSAGRFLAARAKP